MKKILSFLASSVFVISSMAQSNLIVFADNDEHFTMTVDGSAAVNETESRVKFEGIKSDFIQAKITFKDQSLGQVKKGFMIEPNTEITAELRQNKKGAYVIRLISTVPVNSRVKAEPAPQQPMVYPDVESTHEMTTPANESTTTTTTTSQSSSSTINVGLNDGNEGIKINVNMNLNDSENFDSGFGVNTSTTTTTTTTTTSSDPSTNTFDDTYVTEVDCTPMAGGDFSSAKSSIANKSFADDKMILAKQIIKSNCVSTDQVIGIMNLFDFEDAKVEFAKAAYTQTTDPQNYYKVNDAFTYSDSIDELNDFLEGK